MTENEDAKHDHILFLTQRLRGCQTKYIVLVCLLELGVEPKYSGYHFLVHLIMLYVETPAPISFKHLYGAVAGLLYNNSAVDTEHIEHAVRSAIRTAWQKRNDRLWRLFFDPDDDGYIDRPSNAKFISAVAHVVKMCR